MKIILVGGSGVIGSAVLSVLKDRHEIISVGFSSGDIKVDISNIESIKAMFKQVGSFDALISTTGKVHFGAFEEMGSKQWNVGIENKLMGQVNLVTCGLEYINDGGSFTLTSGILNKDPIKYGASAAMINGALEGFVVGAAIEMPRQIRLNIVSPTVLKESMHKYESYFRGYSPVKALEVANAYVKSVEGLQTGQIYRAGW